MSDPTSTFVSLSDIRVAACRIRSIAQVTPLVRVSWPAVDDASTVQATPHGGEHLFLKCEALQPTGTFKIRGAVNMLAQLPADALARGVVAYSAGNHAQGVALAARTLGAKAVIVMPSAAPRVKADAARALGAEVIFDGVTSLEWKARAEREASARGLTMVPPFDHPWIIAGQGTVGLEIVEQLPNVGTIYVPIGGGGLIAGVAVAVKTIRPSVRIIGVEPEGAAKMTRSLAVGSPITLEKVASIADGLLPVRLGDLTFAHAREYVDEVVTVNDSATRQAVAWLFRHARLVAEPSGAIATAAAMLGLGDADSSRGAIVAIVSGGNVEPERYARYVETTMRVRRFRNHRCRSSHGSSLLIRDVR